MCEFIKKRNGRKVPFDCDKILKSVEKAYSAAECEMSDFVRISLQDQEMYKDCKTVDDVSEIVSRILYGSAGRKVYDAFTNYKAMRAATRKKRNLLSIMNIEKNDITNDNANMNSESPAGQMMKYACETTKPLAMEELLAKDVADAMKDGYIYVHDLDYYSTRSLTCVQHPFDKIIKGGFNAGHGSARPTKRIESAAAMAAIALQTAQNEQHGGQAIPAFDFYMAPMVRATYIEEVEKMQEIFGDLYYWDLMKENKFTDYIEEEIPQKTPLTFNTVQQLAVNRTVKRVRQAMESLVHNLNHMHSRGGNQVVFSSLNYGTDTSAEGRLVIRTLLETTLDGVGDGTTAIFPIQIFKCKDGVNKKPGDPNYDLYEKAWPVSARRFFPNYLNLDSSFNFSPEWDENDPRRFENEVATMGALAGHEHLYIKVGDEDPIDISIKDFYEMCKNNQYTARKCQIFCNKEPMETLIRSRATQNKGEFEPSPGVYSITYLPEDITYIGSSSNIARRVREYRSNIRRCGCIDAGLNPADRNIDNYKFEVLEYTDNYKEVEKRYIESIPNVNIRGTASKYYKLITTKFGRHIYTRPNFKQDRSIQQDLIDLSDLDIKVLDRNNQWTKVNHVFKNDKRNSPFMMQIYYKEFDKEYCLSCTEDHPLFNGEGFTRADQLKVGDYVYRLDGLKMQITNIAWGWRAMDNYDIGTATGSFIGSDIIMHNCRTRMWGDRFGKSTSIGRGNLSFTSINLPRLAIEVAIEDGFYKKTSKGYKIDEAANNPEAQRRRVERFLQKLKKYADMVAKQLDDRYKFQAQALAKQFPLVMSQLWIGAENLKPNDTIEEVIKHGTLGVSFIGLAETLIMLTGKHHGESEEANELGMKIIKYLDRLCKGYSDEYDHNYSCFATPAEGLSGRFTVVDRKLFGLIDQVTSFGNTPKDFYTNSSHIPVWYHCSPLHKAQVECPYHKYEPAGHIFYVEADGSLIKNPEAIGAVNQLAFDNDAGYISINHGVPRCTCCSHEEPDWEITDELRVGEIECPVCHGVMSTLDRVTGYLSSTFERQTFGKKDEIKHRVQHK